MGRRLGRDGYADEAVPRDALDGADGAEAERALDREDEHNGRPGLFTHPEGLATAAAEFGPPDEVLDEAPVELVRPVVPEFASRQACQPLPAGRWTDGTETSAGVWIPAAVATSGTELEARRPADEESARVRTSVDRPVASLRPVGIDEARQLAECFALDYMSCDEDDPDLRQLALASYLARRSDALLGWPTERAGVGRQRAIAARAGECLAQGHWVTVDVSVLVEIYHRDREESDAPDDMADGRAPAPARPELPRDARWSAVPPAHATGWTCSMTVWHRLGIPIRRHDSGGLVVELFTVPESES